ncbi:unnamed protein product [Alternaria alternata]
MASKAVLMTGVSGFVGIQTLLCFTSAGYFVRGAVRSQKSAAQVHTAANKLGISGLKYELVIVPDITAPGAFDSYLDGVDGIIHVASPFYNGVKNFDDVYLPAGPRPGYVYTEKDWNPITKEQALRVKPLQYVASKKLAELAAWDFVEAEKPNFSLATVNPPMIYGPVAQLDSTANLNQSALDIWNLMTGHVKEVPPTPLPAFCDVRDVAQAHLKAFEHATGGRFLPVGGTFLFQDVCAILKDVAPEWAGLVPDPEGKPRHEHFLVDNSWTKKELGMSFRGLKETITDTVESFRAMQAKPNL